MSMYRMSIVSLLVLLMLSSIPIVAESSISIRVIVEVNKNVYTKVRDILKGYGVIYSEIPEISDSFRDSPKSS